MAEYKGKVIPFAQSVTFYMRRGAKEVERNDLLTALQRYRLACRAAPNDEEPALAMAQILSYMQRFEESNRLLLRLLSRGDASPECHFGLACNYFGMREYDYAVESLENYLDLEPDGPYAADAEDFLDFLDDDDAMFEAAGLRVDADYDANAACVYAQRLMNAGDYRGAVSVLKRECTHEPDSVPLRNQLILAYFCCGDQAKAGEILRELLESEQADLLTRCYEALMLLTRGEKSAAGKAIQNLLDAHTDSPEVLNAVSLLLVEAERYADAAEILEQLKRLTPYDENVLHRLGYCLYRLGEFPRAQDCYKRLLCVNPDDTVAKYYLKQSRKTDADERYIRAHWSSAYQVPFPELFRRLNQLNRYLLESEDEQRTLWNNDKRFAELLDWSLGLTDSRIKRSVLSLMYLYRDERAENVLRDFLLRTDQPDDLKRAVFGMLKQMGAKEPYMAYMDGRWLQGRVNLLPFSYLLPAAYEAVMQLLVQGMTGFYDDECLTAAAAIYRRYIESLNQSFPRLSTQQVTALAAALELLGSRTCGVEVDEKELCGRYRVTATRLRNALLKLEPFYQEGKETEDT